MAIFRRCSRVSRQGHSSGASACWSPSGLRRLGGSPKGPGPPPTPITCDSWVLGYLLQQGERGKGPHQRSICLPGEGSCGVQLRARGLPQHTGLQTLDAGQAGGQARLLDHVGKRWRLRSSLRSEETPRTPKSVARLGGAHWGLPWSFGATLERQDTPPHR